MFKLYDMNVVKLIDVSENEKDIIDTMGDYISKKISERFNIIKRDEATKTDEGYKRITNVGQYYDYCREYEERQLKDMSCCDLKRSIVKRKRL